MTYMMIDSVFETLLGLSIQTIFIQMENKMLSVASTDFTVLI